MWIINILVWAIPMVAQTPETTVETGNRSTATVSSMYERGYFLDSALGNYFEMPMSKPFAELRQLAYEAVRVGAATKNLRLEARGLQRLVQIFTLVSNQTDSALLCSLHALQLARAAGDTALIGSILLITSLTYLDNFNNYHQAEDYAFQCVRIAERIGQMPLVGFAFNIIGDVHLRLGNPREALPFCRRSLEVREACGDNPTNIAWSLHNLGLVEQALGNIDTAIVYHRRSLALWQAAGDAHGIPQAWKNLGVAYSLKGNHTEAIAFFHKSLELRRAISPLSHFLPPLLTLISTEERNAGQFTASLGHAHEALSIAERGKMQQSMALACRELALTQKALRHFEEALRWQERSNALSDSAARTTMQRAITEISTRFRIEDDAARQATQMRLLEQNNQIAELQLQQQRQTQALTLMGVAAAVIGSGLFFQRYRFRQVLQRRTEREAQRTQISRNMHDEVGAGLTSISLLSELARLSTSPEIITQHVVKIQNTSVAIGNAMREIVWSLNPKNDVPTIFLPYIRAFAGEFLSDAGISFYGNFPDFDAVTPVTKPASSIVVRLTSVLPLVLTQFVSKHFLNSSLPANTSAHEYHFNLTGEARRAVFLVVKEALNNTVKYASATEVRFVVRIESNGYEFTIADNGRGFVLADVPPHARVNGLENMRKRIEDMHGTFHLDSALSQGTTIHFFVPFSA